MSSNIFIPTFLYIKRHTTTGLLYFGKTTQHDPVKYKGSGTYWKNHIKIHGSDKIETLWFCLFLDVESLINFATNFSKSQNIVDEKVDGSKIWANLVEETGIDGVPVGYKRSDETKEKMSNSRKGFRHTEESKNKMSLSKAGITTSFNDPNKNPAKTKEFKEMMKMNNPMFVEETRSCVSETIKQKWIDDPEGMYAKGKYSDPDVKQKQSESKQGHKNPMYGNKDAANHLNIHDSTCIHCGITSTKGNITRWHNDNCKKKKPIEKSLT